MNSTRSRMLGLVLGLAATVWAIFRVAPAPLPALPSFIDSLGNWREANPDPDYDHLRENLIFQWLFEGPASLGVQGYLVVWSLVTALAVGALAVLYRTNATETHKGVAVRLAILSPIAAVLIGFFGSYDPVTVLLAILLVIMWRRSSIGGVFAAGILLGLQHFGQAIPMIIALTFTSMAVLTCVPTRRNISLAGAGLVGTFLGKGLSLCFLFLASSSIGGNRLPDATRELWLRDSLVTSFNYFPALVLSLFAGAWTIVIWQYLSLSRRSRQFLIVSFVVCVLFSFTFTDQTRIFVLISLPSLIILTLDMLKSPPTDARTLRLVEVLAWVITPILIWTGSDGVGRVQYLGAVDAQIMAWQQVFGWG